jgi:phosphatidylethanolamine N-methyltransferase
VGILWLFVTQGLFTQFGSNQSNIVTKTSSLGRWVPVHNEEWDGDLPLNISRQDIQSGVEKLEGIEEGEIVFDKEILPWSPGVYEVSLHV